MAGGLVVSVLRRSVITHAVAESDMPERKGLGSVQGHRWVHKPGLLREYMMCESLSCVCVQAECRMQEGVVDAGAAMCQTAVW